MRLIKISQVNVWVQAANCEISEIITWNPLRIHRNNDLDVDMCATSDLEPFQHHAINILYEIRISCSQKCILTGIMLISVSCMFKTNILLYIYIYIYICIYKLIIYIYIA